MTKPKIATHLNLTQTGLILIACVCLMRIVLLFTTYLDLYPDEAQYWVWSRELDFGYYSKPPMIAWLIHLSTRLGDAEPFVRLFAPLLHAGSACALLLAGRRLYNDKVGALAGLVYTLMPGVVLSSGVISTDACLLFFLSLSLYFYIDFTYNLARHALWSPILLGLSFGAAFLSKYACIYFLIGAVLHIAFDRHARARWSPLSLILCVLTFGVIISPNIIWNATHGFQTVAHTADNADWHAGSLFHPLSALQFLSQQFVVFGFIPFGALIIGLLTFFSRKPVTSATDTPTRPKDLMLICLTLPPLVFVTIQALLSRANANWAASAYVPGSLLAASWLYGIIVTLPQAANAQRRLGTKALLWLGLGAQVLIMVLFMTAAASPQLTRLLGTANAFKQARAWNDTTKAILNEADIAKAQGVPLTAIAVDDRFLFNAMAYYGRDWLRAHPEVPLKSWVREAHPQSHSETHMPLTEVNGKVALLVNKTPRFQIEMRQDFHSSTPAKLVKVPIDHKRTRDLAVFYGYTFDRAPRDPASGHPLVNGKPHE